MRTSQVLLATVKETPADAELISHQLMLRAGMIRKVAAGLYIWLPMGLRVLRKVEAIVREEMDAAGAQELLMPTVQPGELWRESRRWEQYGPELLRFMDRHEREFCYGPTHEEVITDLIRREIRSYKHLPANFYQIQSKFRDEIRPRFGVMRAREFLMKDAYSFHLDTDSLKQTYDRMYQAYSRIFTRLGLNFRAVQADTGSIGGSYSHEFHVLANSGEDAIAFSTASDYAANVELAEALAPSVPRAAPVQTFTKVATPNLHSIEQLSAHFGVPAERMVKTLLVEGKQGLVALLLRGDHVLNAVKAEKLRTVETPLKLATALQDAGAQPERTEDYLGMLGSLGPVGLKLPIIADRAVIAMSDFVCGANQPGYHYLGVNWGRDLPEPQVADLRNVVDGDPSPDGIGTLTIKRGIEVGHIFQLGTKYSLAMGATVLDEKGHAVTMTMGCYGIGVSRVVAAAVEQYHDAQGILWPLALAPYQVALIPINMHKSERLRMACEQIYADLTRAGIETLFDDRKERAGVMFADMDLLGIPHRLVLGDRGIDAGEIEYKARRSHESVMIPISSLVELLTPKLWAQTRLD